MEETGVHGEKHRPDKLYHIMLYQAHLAWAGFELTTSVVIGIDCIGSCQSNYHTITTTMVHLNYMYMLLDIITWYGPYTFNSVHGRLAYLMNKSL